MRSRVPKPLLTSGGYSYLRFIGKSYTDITEVYLPNDESYVVNLDQLRVFLDNSKVEDSDKLIDFIYNFGNVFWKRSTQSYYPLTRDKMLPKDRIIDVVEEIYYELV